MSRVSLVLLLTAFVAMPVFSQESRAIISGTVTDPQGAVIPGAGIQVRNLGTNVVAKATTSDRGVYQAPPLNPGMYSVTATASGFKSLVRNNIELRVGDRIDLDIKLEIGQVSESVEVTAEAPMLETATASSGTVIDKSSVAALPMLGRNPFSLMQYAGGEVHTAVMSASGAERPFDNGGMDTYSINGGQRMTNEFLLDGSPNTTTEGSSPTNLGFVPPPDAVGEFKMQSNLYDAEYGRTGGGVVNVSLKSGTNDLHGAAYWYLRNDKLNANSVQSNAAGIPLSAFRWAQPGGQIQGPVVLPHLYNGRNKSFFMYSIELVRSSVPRPSSLVVPTVQERLGDFSQTLYNGKPIAIYDPLTTVQASPGVYQRTPFSNSQLPSSRINPIGTKLLSYYPMPNGVAARGLTNLTVAPNATTDAYNAHTFRLDQVVTDSSRFFFSFNRGNRNELGGLSGGRQAFFANGHPEAANTYNHWRVNHGAVLNWTSLLSPTWVSTTRASFQRHQFAIMDMGYGYDPTAVGWPTSMVSQLQAPSFPAVAISNYTQLGRNGSTVNFSNSYAAGETLSKVLKNHSLKIGGEVRAMRTNVTAPTGMGSLAATQGFTQANPLTGDAASGDAVASLLLGYLSSGTNSYNNKPAWGNHYYVMFVQDDWRVNRKLTLNFGLRWDYESPQTDRYDRNVIGFDPSTPSHIGSPAGPLVFGGLLFATPDRRFAYHRDLNNFQPRVGLAYQISSKFVFRTGWGISYLPTLDYPPTSGFSTSTPLVSSADGGITPILFGGAAATAGRLTNPYPDGINHPAGSSLGLQSFLGQGITYINPNRNIPFVHSFSAGFQYQLPIRSLLDVSYVGSRTRGLEVGKNIDQITASQYTSIAAGLLATQANPYAGLLPGTSLNNGTVTLQQAMLPYPQFTGVTENGRNIGIASYNSLQVKLEKRLSAGLYVLFNYTWSNNMTRNTYLNGAYDRVGQLARIISADDIPHNFNLSFTYRLPFEGKGIQRAVLGGWQMAGNFSWMTGPLMSISGVLSTGVNPKLDNPSFQRWFNTCTVNTSGKRQNCASDSEAAAWIIIPPYTLTNTNPRSAALRQYRPMQSNLSLFKNFTIWEKLKAEFRAEAFNAFNTPEFSAANTTSTSSLFGVVTNTQANDPRAIQAALRLTF